MAGTQAGPRATPPRCVLEPYSWCRGPTGRQLRRIEALGFSVERYVGSFGHALYRRLPVDAPDALVARNKHGLYCVPRSSAHRPCAAAILLGEVRESKLLDVMCQYDSEADIVHAGAYYGDFLPALSRSRSDGALVWAF